MAVFVLDKSQKPLMPCSEKRARLLLERGRARIHRIRPFTIRLIDRKVEDSILQPIKLKIDPGSKGTGMALVRVSDVRQTVLTLIELKHRGANIRDALTRRKAFRRRRRGKLRFRPARFDNRKRPEGWLPPSLQHRVGTTMSWVDRLRRLSPVSSIDTELVRFDTQLLENPDISGVEYQQGTLAGYTEPTASPASGASSASPGPSTCSPGAACWTPPSGRPKAALKLLTRDGAIRMNPFKKRIQTDERNHPDPRHRRLQ